MDELFFFVTSSEKDAGMSCKPFTNRRFQVNPLFSLSVAIFSIAKVLKLNPDNCRLWHCAEGGAQTLLDLNQNPSEAGLANGAKLILEIASEDGSWHMSFQPPSVTTRGHGGPIARENVASALAGVGDAAASQNQFSPVPSPDPFQIQQNYAHDPPRYQPQGTSSFSTNQQQQLGSVNWEELQVQSLMEETGKSQREQLAKEEELHVRLATVGLKVRRIRDDGNCLFRALSDQMYDSQEQAYQQLRQEITTHMLHNPQAYMPFIVEDFESYIALMSCDKTYGTNLELQGFVDLYSRPVHVYSDQDNDTDPLIISNPNIPPNAAPIRLSYQRGNHYQSVVSLDAATPAQPASVAAAQPTGVFGAKRQCPYCDSMEADLDLHLVITHANMFT